MQNHDKELINKAEQKRQFYFQKQKAYGRLISANVRAVK